MKETCSSVGIRLTFAFNVSNRFSSSVRMNDVFSTSLFFLSFEIVVFGDAWVNLLTPLATKTTDRNYENEKKRSVPDSNNIAFNRNIIGYKEENNKKSTPENQQKWNKL